VKWLAYEEIEKMIDGLSKFFGVDPPNIVVNCRETCEEGGSCRFIACYRHEDDALCFTQILPSEQTVAHEFGHCLHHRWYPGVCRGMSPECERHAIALANWWMKDAPIFTCEICGGEVADLNFEYARCGRCSSLYRNEQVERGGVRIGREIMAEIAMGILAALAGYGITSALK